MGVATDGPSTKTNLRDLESGRTKLTITHSRYWAAAGGGAAGAAEAETPAAARGGGALCAPSPTERCLSGVSAHGPMGTPAAFTGTSGRPSPSLVQVILKSS